MIYLYLYIFLNVVYNKAFENEIIYNYAVNKYNEKSTYFAEVKVNEDDTLTEKLKSCSELVD